MIPAKITVHESKQRGSERKREKEKKRKEKKE